MSSDEAIRFSTAKFFLFSGSALCLGKVHPFPQSNVELENKLEWFKDSYRITEVDRTEGEPMELEWTNFPGFTTLQILSEIRKLMTELNCESEHVEGRIIFMSMCNDIEW